jgi:hypothetical protein
MRMMLFARSASSSEDRSNDNWSPRTGISVLIIGS